MAFDYNFEYFKRADGIASWSRRALKFGDALAAIGYSMDIPWEDISAHFGSPFTGPEDILRNENHPFTIDDQLAFLEKRKRTPKNVLEIGGGRGEVAATYTKLNIPITSVEIGSGAMYWYQDSGKKFFGDSFVNTPPIQKPFEEANIDYTKFDTILMVESLEHIPAQFFDPEMEKILNNFHGYFIVVNWKPYHPIAIGQYADPEQHCRLVDDALYDKWASRAKRTIYRDRAHLVLEF